MGILEIGFFLLGRYMLGTSRLIGSVFISICLIVYLLLGMIIKGS